MGNKIKDIKIEMYAINCGSRSRRNAVWKVISNYFLLCDNIITIPFIFSGEMQGKVEDVARSLRTRATEEKLAIRLCGFIGP